ncbi:hypothetical protein H6F32_12160 [Anabaena sp. FACHB-1237]|uniref:hypothetical protein n=1 Tax=Anabaena sp. FACHB-1237 TaxID=2692769 RepID=UPI001681A303|nr:hypothetical protein [Anabaena sp. FACHB-1237]MBD2138328.1 hypothetical protein [Anabaena sp. FACHB-1237]
MSSLGNHSQSQPGLNFTPCYIPINCLLHIGTVSLLMLLIAEKTTVQGLAALGEAGEELFRGDRLPILNFPSDAYDEGSYQE